MRWVRPWIWRVVAARPRLFFGIAAGVVCVFLLPQTMAQGTRAVVAWDTGVTTYLLLAALLFTAERAERMPEDAEAQQEGEWTIFWLTVAAIAFSFIAVVQEFAAMKGVAAAEKSVRLGLVTLTLLASWLMTHTTFAFRYAHEYYARDVAPPELDRGLDFPNEPRPDYLDFMYFALVLGTTFQVSDVQITSRKLRRLATLHGVLSFLFNTIIVALTVNLAAGLL